MISHDVIPLLAHRDTPTIPSLSFHKQGNITISTQKNDSLWAIGNNYIRFAVREPLSFPPG